MPKFKKVKKGFATPQAALASLKPLHKKIAEVADKTPSTVVDAFLSEPIDIAGIELPPIRMNRWLYLEKINSPFLQGADAMKNASLEDLFRALYVIMQPREEVRLAVQCGGETLAKAVDAFADRIPVSALPGLTEKFARHLAAEFAPRADLVREEEGGGGGPKAQPPASSATAPAAG